jgi:hypothetical protein
MRRSELGKTLLRYYFMEPSIAQLACSHLDGKSMRFRECGCIKSRSKAGNVLLCSNSLHKIFIAIGIFTAQLKITMRYRDREPGLLKKMEHYHRVDATTDGQQDAVVFPAKCMLVNMVQKLL